MDFTYLYVSGKFDRIISSFHFKGVDMILDNMNGLDKLVADICQSSTECLVSFLINLFVVTREQTFIAGRSAGSSGESGETD